eukprot:373050-Lingulodinium_polyedra.AAC.1
MFGPYNERRGMLQNEACPLGHRGRGPLPGALRNALQRRLAPGRRGRQGQRASAGRDEPSPEVPTLRCNNAGAEGAVHHGSAPI